MSKTSILLIENMLISKISLDALTAVSLDNLMTSLPASLGLIEKSSSSLHQKKTTTSVFITGLVT